MTESEYKQLSNGQIVTVDFPEMFKKRMVGMCQYNFWTNKTQTQRWEIIVINKKHLVAPIKIVPVSMIDFCKICEKGDKQTPLEYD